MVQLRIVVVVEPRVAQRDNESGGPAAQAVGLRLGVSEARSQAWPALTIGAGRSRSFCDGSTACRRRLPDILRAVLAIRVLGRLSVESADDVDSIGLPSSRRARDLLAYLATHQEMHLRPGLAARFWPDVPEASARSSLRGALTELRRSLGPERDALQATREAVGLDPGRVWVDLIEFRRFAAEQRWSEALELDQGRLLADVEYDWADWLRSEHGDALADVLSAMVRACVAEGRPGEAVALARRWVRLDPLSEAATTGLIEALVLSGDRSSAVEAGRALGDRLLRELGVRPSVALSRLMTGLIEGPAGDVVNQGADPGVAVSGPTAPRLDELTAPRLVGRSAQLDQLRALRSRARLHTAVLWGAAGIGKTSLAVAAAKEAASDDCTVLYGRCDEEGIVPYCAWIEALGPAIEALDLELRRQLVFDGGAQLLRWFPALQSFDREAARTTTSDGTGGSVWSMSTIDEPSESDRWRLFEAVTRLLVRLSLRRPVLLVIDDLHWADRSTLLLLRHVIRTTQEAAVTVIATSRSSDADPDAPVHLVLAQLRRDRLLTEIELRGLSEDQVRELVDAHPAGPNRPALTRALFAETEGNPFFVSEILRNLPADAPTREGRFEPGFVLSTGIRDLLRRRIQRLDPATAELLRVAAVVGRDFELHTVERVSGQPEQTVLSALESAPDVVGEVAVGRFTFTHSLIRAALYEDLSRTRRARLHAQVARALEERLASGSRAAPSAAELAHHFLATGDPSYADLAVGYTRQAYVEAMSGLAYNEAAELTRRLVEAVRGWFGDIATVGSLLLELGEALSQAGDTAASRTAFRQAATVARAQDEPVWLATAALGYAGPSWQGFGTVEDDTIELLQEARSRIVEVDSSLHIRLSARLAIAMYFADRPGELRDLTESAVERARLRQDDGVLAAALESRLWAQWRPDLVQERITTAEELMAVAQRSGLTGLAMTGLRWRVFTLIETGDLAGAWQEAEHHAEEARRLQLPYELMYVAVFAFTRAVLEGRIDDAVLASTQVQAFGETRGGADAVQFGGVHALTFAYLNGQLATLPDAVAGFAAGFPAVPGWHAASAVTLLAAGRKREAERELDRVWPPEQGLPFDAVWLAAMGFCSLAVVLLADAERAQHLSEQLQPFTGRPVVLGAGGAVWGTVDVYLALLATVTGDHDAAQRYEARAAADLARMGSDLQLLLAGLPALTPTPEVSR